MPSIQGTPSLEETQCAARILFRQFCTERFEEEHIESEVALTTVQELSSEFDGYANSVLASVGRDLRRIAEEIQLSNERERIRRRACEVRIFDITYDHFRSLLLELFLNGVSRERIVVLFFFCSDLACRAFNSGPREYCVRLLRWSLDFILDNICSWVQRQGGWEAVFGTYVKPLVSAAFLVLGCTAFALYIKNNWPPSKA